MCVYIFYTGAAAQLSIVCGSSSSFFLSPHRHSPEGRREGRRPPIADLFGCSSLFFFFRQSSSFTSPGLPQVNNFVDFFNNHLVTLFLLVGPKYLTCLRDRALAIFCFTAFEVRYLFSIPPIFFYLSSVGVVSSFLQSKPCGSRLGLKGEKMCSPAAANPFFLSSVVTGCSAVNRIIPR